MSSLRRRMGFRLALALLVALMPACALAQSSTPLTVFAAASLKDALDDAAARYQRRTGQPVRVAYAGSAALARQIGQRAPADVFVSADVEWMDWLQARGLVEPGSRRDLLGNTLVLIAPAGSTAQPFTLDRGRDLRPLLGTRGRLSLALTASVPAGKYAKAAFESLGIWDALRPRIAESDSVRAALALVARGETPLGVVYASDALAEPRVKVLATFPADSHPPIVYPLARMVASPQPTQADAFVRWLAGDEAAGIFRRHGVHVLAQ